MFYMKKFRIYFLIIFLVELFSLIGFLLPQFREISFFVILGITLLLAVEKLEYGILILLTELFIGSKGYLFFYEYEGISISIRMGLFLIIMSAWLGKMVLKWATVPSTKEDDYFKLPKLKDKVVTFEDFKKWSEKLQVKTKNLSQTKNQSIYFYFAILFIFIAWGLVNGILNNNSFNSIFFDFNGWVYFGIIFPFAYLLQNRNKKEKNNFAKNILIIFSTAITWLSVKTLGLLYIFSHDFGIISEKLYRWVRITGVGEVNFTELGFSRIFIQSQVYVVIGLFIFLSLILYFILKRNWKQLFYCSIVQLLLIATILVSFSRSFWLGLGIGLLLYCFFVLLFFYKKWKAILLQILILIITSVLSIGLIWGIVRFPVPTPLSGFDLDMLSERATSISGEAGVSSRWNLLPPLWEKIKQAPITGQGFGSEVTYISNDPRVREVSVSGEYTTYAFEWGWLDIWLKLGLFGLLAYVVLLIKIFWDGIIKIKKSEFKIRKLIYIALLSGLVMIIITSFFSPYLNHPLGIGYVVLVSLILSSSGLTKLDA